MSGSVSYRLIKPGEEQLVFGLVERVFDEFVRRDFTKEGIANFLHVARAMLFDQSAQHFVMVVESTGRLIGVIDVRESSHISRFFVETTYQRQGIGRQLLNEAVALCCGKKPSLTAIDVHSSLWAVSIYEKLGFIQTGPEEERSGIRFVPMVKILKQPNG